MALDDAFSKALLHMDGSDAATTFTDESGKTWTAAGNAQIDTAQSKFGGAAGLFDGTGDSISTPDHADFAFGSDSFTIDFWVRYATVGIGGLYGQHVDSNNYCVLYRAGTPAVLRFLVVSAGSTIIDIQNSWTPSTNTWYHVALVRSGNDWLMFVDGTQIGTTASDTSAFPDFAATAIIGSHAETAALNGHLDEYRVSKGIARWTANFTPEVVQYDNLNGSATLEGGMDTTPAATPDYLALTTYLTKTSLFTE